MATLGEASGVIVFDVGPIIKALGDLAEKMREVGEALGVGVAEGIRKGAELLRVPEGTQIVFDKRKRKGGAYAWFVDQWVPVRRHKGAWYWDL